MVVVENKNKKRWNLEKKIKEIQNFSIWNWENTHLPLALSPQITHNLIVLSTFRAIIAYSMMLILENDFFHVFCSDFSVEN